ncbi:MAG: EAL domain-containing protein [Burkholderiales bacterium]|nr:EAL domain-containing protein [Burkholderiales bacterium]
MSFSMLHHDLLAVRTHRVRLMLQGAGWLLIGVGVPWALNFSIQGLWVLASIDVVLVVAGTIVLWSARNDHLRLGWILLISCAYLATSSLAFFLDVPDGKHPRSVHLFLLSLAFASYLMLQLERRILYLGVPILCMATFLVFASSSIGYQLPFAIPEAHRAANAWFNNLSAMVCLFIVMVLMHADIRVRTALEADLHAGLEQRQLVLHYQPQVDVDGRILGAEALVRWNHPLRGLVPPNEFIPLAEQCGMITAVGRVVLEAACLQLVEWSKNPDRAHLTIAVNVSAIQILEGTFVKEVTSVLDRTKADPTRLKIELTETMFANDLDDIIAKMAALRARGIAISLDDFGTGYSSLNYIKRLPLDQLKIDKSFVDDVLTDPSDAAIARTVVSLSQNLGLHVIAEGVETEAQRAFLESIGCKAYQGYLYSKPLAAADFEQFVQNWARTRHPHVRIVSGLESGGGKPRGA